MKQKGFTAEQIIGKLREAEVLLSQRSTVGEASRKLGVTEHTYHQWRRETEVARNEEYVKLVQKTRLLIRQCSKDEQKRGATDRFL
jgi:transposase-like protein